jgi:hypothetical protein
MRNICGTCTAFSHTEEKPNGYAPCKKRAPTNFITELHTGIRKAVFPEVHKSHAACGEHISVEGKTISIKGNSLDEYFDETLNSLACPICDEPVNCHHRDY